MFHPNVPLLAVRGNHVSLQHPGRAADRSCSGTHNIREQNILVDIHWGAKRPGKSRRVVVRWVLNHIKQSVAKILVVEHAITAPHSSAAGAEDIPCKPDARRKIVPVLIE